MWGRIWQACWYSGAQDANKLNFAIERWDMDYDLATANVKPNFMQRKALKELNRYRAVGTNRALVVAAAGSGKTYLAAFDRQQLQEKRADSLRVVLSGREFRGGKATDGVAGAG